MNNQWENIKAEVDRGRRIEKELNYYKESLAAMDGVFEISFSSNNDDRMYFGVGNHECPENKEAMDTIVRVSKEVFEQRVVELQRQLDSIILAFGDWRLGNE